VTDDTLVSVGLPVRNGERTLEKVIRSVLAQDHERLELVISDNASTDRTEALCREWAEADSRIRYLRHPQNVGLLNNFVEVICRSRGTFFRWIGDDDWLAPRCISRCLEKFAQDPRLILVTTQIDYTRVDGTKFTYEYTGTALRSNDPIERLRELVTLMVYGMRIDPLYGLLRRQPVAQFSRRNMIREDEVFATKLVLAGPWDHVPDVLAHRHVVYPRLTRLVRRLGVPSWQAYFSNTIQCREMLRAIAAADLTAGQRRSGQAAVLRLLLGRHYRKITDQGDKIARLLDLRH
jgi:glycosyltransferase involved in cell wall biosynthesis